MTTAPVTITQSDYQFICQESLPFTLRNSSTIIHLTKAPGIQVKYEEKSSDVPASGTPAVLILKKKYIKEDWNGSIMVINTKNESITLIIKLRLYGDMSKYSLAPKVDAVQHGNSAANKLHDIRWDILLEPHQKQEINYHRVFLKS